jgi:hypothetical protein
VVVHRIRGSCARFLAIDRHLLWDYPATFPILDVVTVL